jgi:hypothetical protein
VLVCVGVPILRRTNPSTARPFRLRAPWAIGGIGAAACLFVMIGLPVDTWGRLVVWLEIGLALYFTYGRYWSKVRQGLGTVGTPPSVSPAAGIAMIVAGVGSWIAMIWIWPLFWRMGEALRAAHDASEVESALRTIAQLAVQFAAPGAIVAGGVALALIGLQSRGGARPGDVAQSA